MIICTFKDAGFKYLMWDNGELTRKRRGAVVLSELVKDVQERH